MTVYGGKEAGGEEKAEGITVFRTIACGPLVVPEVTSVGCNRWFSQDREDYTTVTVTVAFNNRILFTAHDTSVLRVGCPCVVLSMHSYSRMQTGGVTSIWNIPVSWQRVKKKS